MNKHGGIVLAVFFFLAVFLTILLLSSATMAFAAAVGFAALGLIFFKPFIGLIIYLIMLYVRPQDFMPALERLRVMLLLAGMVLAAFLVHKMMRRERIPILATRQHIFMAALLFLVPLSDIVNGQFVGAWDGLNEFLTVYLLFLLIVSIADDFRKFRIVCWTLVLCTVFIAANGVIMNFRGTGLAGTTPVEGTRVRWIGIFGDPNDLALAINSFLPFMLIFLFEKGASNWKKLLILVGSGICILSIYYTASRGGYIAFIAMLSFFAIKRWGLVKGFGIGAVFLVAATVLAPSRMGNISPYEVSAAGRVNAWIDGLVFLKAHPILGIGYQNFGDFGGIAAHSAFIQCLVELGIIGYFVWLSLLYTCVSDVRRFSRTADSPYVWYGDVLVVAFVGFAGSAAFLSQAYMPILYLLVALAVLVAQQLPADHQRSKFLEPVEILHVGLIMVASVIAYKILAMVYI